MGVVSKINYKHSISKRLIFYIVTFSSLITLLITAYQLIQEYLSGVNQVKGKIAQIETLSMPGLTDSVWNLYDQQIQAQLNALIQLPDIRYLEIRFKGEVIASEGVMVSENTISRIIPMVYHRVDEANLIGELLVVATLDDVFRDIYDKAMTIFISNAIKTTLVSVFIFLIFHHIVTRHLVTISKHLKNLSPDHPDKRLSLSRRPHEDELNQVVATINELGRNLNEKTVSKNYIETIFSSMTSSLIVLNPDATIKQANKASYCLLGYDEQELIGQPITALLYDKQDIFRGTGIEDLIKHGGKQDKETTYLAKNGKKIPVLLSASIMQLENNQTKEIVCIARDITELKEAERQITRLAFFDPLTNLANRFTFNNYLGKAVDRFNRENQSFAVLMLDLDRFKDVNDTLGHPIGDKLLKAVSNRLVKSLRQSDRMVRFSAEFPEPWNNGIMMARLGGDEFAIIQAVLPEKHAAVLARRILDNLSKPFSIEGHEIHVTASVGISIYNSPQNNPNELMRQADTALYKAKESGRSMFFFFDEEMNQEVYARAQINEELRHAIERDEFVLFYQPQVDTINGQIIGLEALIRWQHPKRGLVPPLDFIPAAERTGQIIAIGEWVLRHACQQRLAWTRQGLLPDAQIAINLSALQIRQHDFENKVLEILDETGIDPSLIELEITETLLLERADEVISLIERVRKQNVSFSIDDFGTGYSSLQYLKRLPVQRLKVAQEFVRNAPHDLGDVAIITAVIELARQFGLRSIAEGVETEEQLALLQEKGCDEIQGYYFSRPLAVKELLPLLKAGRIIRNGIEPVEHSPVLDAQSTG